MKWYKNILTKSGKILKKTMMLIGIIFFIFFLVLVVFVLKYEYFEKPELIKQCLQAGNSLEVCQGRFD